MKTRRCSKCGEVKPYEMFHRNKSRKDGYKYECKVCSNAYTKKYYKSYYKDNKEKLAEYLKVYKKANKAKINEINARREALKRKAVPKFLKECRLERQRLRDIYKLREVISLATGIEHHVDHMWPLSDGGPHWSGNLQIITAKENLTKKDKVCRVTKKNIKDSLRIARKEYENSSNGH